MYAHILQGNSGQETVWTPAMFFLGGGRGSLFLSFILSTFFFPSVYILRFFYIYFWCGPYLKFLLNLLQYCFWSTFWFFGLEVCGMLALRQRSNPSPWVGRPSPNPWATRESAILSIIAVADTTDAYQRHWEAFMSTHLEVSSLILL